MHIPNEGRIEGWIRELIKEGKLYKFYKTNEWLALRDQVLSDHHYECLRCEKQGRLRIADMVHHEYEVCKHPGMALTRYVEGADGRREVLQPLCNQCHNEVHNRTLKGTPRKPPITEERW